MYKDYNILSGKFQHVTLIGEPYEIGKIQGKNIREGNQILKQIIRSTKVNIKQLGFDSFREIEEFYEENCPGINEEIQGFADALDIPKEKIHFFSLSYSKPSNCSQFVVLSSITDDNHIYAGNSYEWIPEDEDLRLVTTKVKGKYAHIGFSGFFFGRLEGFNEFGLTITHSGAGIFDRPLKTKGVKFWVIIRTLLENCKTVKEARKVLKTISVSEFFSLIITDKNENTLLFETADGVNDFFEINKNSDKKVLLAVNHFQLPKMRKYNKLNVGIITNSKKRTTLIESVLNGENSPIPRENIINLLAKKFPHGLCYHYYSQRFGTLWSMLFDISSSTVDICFGAPTHNSWHTFDFNTPYKKKEYDVLFPDIEEYDWL